MNRPKMTTNGEMMCWICVSSPIDFVSNNEADENYIPYMRKLRKIARLKSVLAILDSQPGIDYCPDGTSQAELLKTMQYDLSREL